MQIVNLSDPMAFKSKDFICRKQTFTIKSRTSKYVSVILYFAGKGIKINMLSIHNVSTT
jgi:hypothetical protein